MFYRRFRVNDRHHLLVRCADGTELAADLLVGADGSNSRIRAQRLPGVDRQELGILNIAGRVPLTAELSARLPATFTDGSVNNVAPDGLPVRLAGGRGRPRGQAPHVRRHIRRK